MGLLIFDLSIAILNMVSFFINQNIMGYVNFVIGCLCFVCVGMQLKEVVDKKFLSAD